MKRAISLVLVMLFAIPVLAFCQEATEEAGTGMGEGMMMHQGMMAGEAGKEGMQKKHAMKCMMDMMMNKQMVATSDGGVVVLFGHKLYKYDKNLNLVKEAEIKMDFEAMKKKMQEMKEKCPMYEKMMQGKEEATEKKD